MNKHILFLMLASTSLAFAADETSDPIQLSAQQMDQVTAGLFCSGCSGLSFLNQGGFGFSDFSSPTFSLPNLPNIFGPSVEDPPLPPVEE